MSILKKYLKTKPVCKATFKLEKDAAREAQSVVLVGDFNNWDQQTTPMHKQKDGSFAVTLDLEAGRLQIGAQPARVFRGSHSCGDPAWVLADWLRHATARHGRLPAGSVVTTGTWAGAPPASPGDEVVLAFDGIGQAVTHF